MTTTQDSTTGTPTEHGELASRSSRFAAIAMVGLIALVIGGLADWAIRGDGDDVPEVVVAGGEELTDRQEEMIEFHQAYLEAWSIGDVEALRSMYAPEGTLTFNGTTYEVASPEFADYVGLGTVGELLPPHLVKGDAMLNVVEVVGYSSENVLTFTGSGELLLVSHVIVSDIS